MNKLPVGFKTVEERRSFFKTIIGAFLFGGLILLLRAVL